MKRYLYLSAALLSVGILGAGDARAQTIDFAPSWYETYTTTRTYTEAQIGRSILESSQRDRAGRRRSTPNTSRRSPSGTSAPTGGSRRTGGTTTASGSTTFRPVAASVAPQELAREMAQSPADRAKLERMFGDLLANYRNRLRRSGGQANDVARAASYLIAASQMVYFDTGFMSAQKYDALRAQLSDAFATDPQFQSMSNRERQKMFESYGIAATWIDAGFRIVKEKGDGQAMQQWREMARRNFENMLGASPEKVRFTDAGVEYQ